MSDRGGSLGVTVRARGVPALGQAVSATGGAAVALGVLLVSIDIRAENPGRAAPTALFAALVVAGYLVVALGPRETHPAGVTAVVLGIPGALGWGLLPGARSFGDIRPFLVLTIMGWLVAFALPRTRGRTIFVAAAAVLVWLWILGEVSGTGAYSAAPIPSPPAHTLFSLQSLAGERSTVALGDLDSTDPLYPLAQQCDSGDEAACDTLFHSAPAGSDFQQFGATCGNTQPSTNLGGTCELRGNSSVGGPTLPLPNLGSGSLARTTSNKTFDIGLVSALFGVAYLGALYLLDRAGWRGLATAFVVPGFVALVTGAQSLGEAAHHAWATGAFTFVAGLVIGVVGDRTGRRFTTWAGGLTVALGGLTVALDAAHISHAVSNGNVKLAGPGLIVMAFGVGLVALAFVIAQLLRHPGGGGASSGDDAGPMFGAPGSGAPAPGPEPPGWPTLFPPPRA